MEAIYQVGGVSAPAWAAFGDVAQVVFDQTGRLYVLDRSAKSVTIVSPDGTFSRTVGGPGDGPGELAFPTGLARDRDGALIIFDQARRSFVTYDSLGGFLRSFPLDPDIVAPAGPLGIDPGGRVFATRDERVEAFTSLLWDGVHEYTYVARATTPGQFVVPPPKAEEMYSPETFGRGASTRVVVY